MTRVAAIDCGTNSFRLLIADISADGSLHDVVRRAEIVRLGEGVDASGTLTTAALARARAVLVSFATQLHELGVDKVRLVATSATRDASNADEFRLLALETVAVEPEVISGAEEAYLSFTGAVRSLQDSPAPWCVIDVGGGSTELVLGAILATASTRQCRSTLVPSASRSDA